LRESLRPTPTCWLCSALQHGFYVEAADTTDGRILTRLTVDALASQGDRIEYEAFYELWPASGTICAAKSDSRCARALGVRNFPTLLLEMGCEMLTISGGYAFVGELE
jgi:putative protein-disulfide isomerase